VIVFPDQPQAIQALVMVSAALLVATRAFTLSARWAGAALVLGAVCLGVALVATIVTWEGP